MYHFWTQNTFTVSCPMAPGGGGGGGGGVGGFFFLGGGGGGARGGVGVRQGGIWVNYFCWDWVHVCACMCCWPLRTPTLLKSILWPIDPISSIFEDPILVTFCLCIYLIQPFN